MSRCPLSCREAPVGDPLAVRRPAAAAARRPGRRERARLAGLDVDRPTAPVGRARDPVGEHERAGATPRSPSRRATKLGSIAEVGRARRTDSPVAAHQEDAAAIALRVGTRCCSPSGEKAGLHVVGVGESAVSGIGFRPPIAQQVQMSRCRRRSADVDARSCRRGRASGSRLDRRAESVSCANEHRPRLAGWRRAAARDDAACAKNPTAPATRPRAPAQRESPSAPSSHAATDGARSADASMPRREALRGRTPGRAPTGSAPPGASRGSGGRARSSAGGQPCGGRRRAPADPRAGSPSSSRPPCPRSKARLPVSHLVEHARRSEKMSER